MEQTIPGTPVKTGNFRDIPLDILRGLAIVLMIMANLTPALFLPPAPGWYRFLSTLAAPLFIVTAGMLVALSRTGKGRSLSYMAIRGGLVILAGVLLQVLAFDYIPFMDMDVLYLIGLSLPVAYLYLGLPERKRWIIILAILVLTPVLWMGFGYSTVPAEPDISILLSPNAGTSLPGITDMVKAWFIDGWFPIFPWIALSLFGAEIGMYRWRSGAVRTFRYNKEGLYTAALLGAGGILWIFIPGAQYVRNGYVELFYPPVAGLLVFCGGFFLLALTVLDHLSGQYSRMDPLKTIGECSLAIYLLHYAIILKIIEPLNIRLPLPEYLVWYFVLLISMILVAYLLRYIRKSWRNQPFLVRFLIGS